MSSLSAPKCAKNDVSRAGQLASKKVLFGDHSRYAVYAVHTRFGEIQWFVSDAERIDEMFDLPMVIRQEPSFELAVQSLSHSGRTSHS